MERQFGPEIHPRAAPEDSLLGPLLKFRLLHYTRVTHMAKPEIPRAYDPRRLIEYELPDEWQVLAGRTAADNDYLSLKVAKARDFWFHVRGQSGSHVLLLSQTDGNPDRETLKRAASIAAYHSKARSGGVVAVSCTRAQYVTKPRGARSGTVTIRKETVFKVRPIATDQLATMKRGED